MNLIDMHCDTIWKLMEQEEIGLRQNRLGIDLQKLRRAKSSAQFFACFIYMKQFEGENRYTKGYEYAKKMIARGKSEFKNNADEIALVESWYDYLENQKEGKISAFLTIEEGGILDDQMHRLEELYKEGIRLITLLWNEENCIGFPNSKEREVMQKGLKSFGFELIEQMNEKKMIIDTSHLSDGGFWDVIHTSKTPVVASHSNARSICPHPRNLSDDMIRALSEKGGVMGVNFYPYFLNVIGKASVHDLAEHILHIMNVGGEEVVAIGTDFDGFDQGELEFIHIGQIERLYEALKKRRVTDRQIEKIWSGNVLRVIQEII